MISIALRSIIAHRSRTLLSILSITIGVASIFLFVSLINGINKASTESTAKVNPLNQIIVRPRLDKTGLVSFLTKSEKGKLTDQTIEDIKKIDGIKNIYPEIQFGNFASVEVQLVGIGVLTDAMVFGVPYEFIKDEIQSEETWKSSEEPYPAILPRKIIELYNLSVASPQGLPLLSEKDLIGKEMIFYPRYSTFFGSGENDKSTKITLKIVGFSDKASLLGPTLPIDTLNKLNRYYAPSGNNSYTELFVETFDQNKTTQIAKEIENLNLSTQYFTKDMKEVQAKISYLSMGLALISFIIILLSAIAIISTFLSQIAERRKELGLLRALGATRKQIKLLIMSEAGFIGFIGSTIGIGTGILTSIIFDKYVTTELKNTILLPDTLFQITPEIIIATLAFGICLSILAAYIPANAAAKVDPITALK
ncbi:MAG: ABC transporter permease [Candidatus Peregrinibacteria bacterium]|nr:ABC transporter permease [Candidatus Peregrinibacteria bacterium]